MVGQHDTRFDHLVQQVSDSIAIHGADGELVYLSPAAGRLLGAAVEELLATSVISRVHPDDLDHLAAVFLGWMSQPGIGAPVEYRLAHADGHWVHVESIGNNRLDDPEINGVVVTTRDITERKRLERELTHRAMHDTLTGLANRALLADRLEQAMARRGSVTALLFVDLDRFKVVNDSIGHAAGDQLLVEVADRLRTVLRAGDTLSRMGGDEFVVLCPATPAPDAARVAERILTELDRPVRLPDRTAYDVKASIGVAVSVGADTAGQLMSAADAAMYRAKALGGNRYHISDDATRATTLRELHMETELARALERGQLEMHYQPIVSLADGAVIGAEALMRWQHPEFGSITPALFIPVAERSGSIVALGRWALDQAAQRAVEWQTELGPGFEVAVNLSGRELLHPEFLAHLQQVLARPGLAPESMMLCLEVTESMLMADPDQIAATLRAARAGGCRIAIDDFGTGYSSFAYLRQFPIDILKIDRSFIAGLPANTTDRVLVEAMVNLARSLGVQVIAEGVETVAQAELLARMGCPTAQGFLWSTPVPAARFLAVALRHAA